MQVEVKLKPFTPESSFTYGDASLDDFVFGGDKGIKSSMMALSNESVIEKIIETAGYDFLIETLELDEETFSTFYGDSSLSIVNRTELKNQVLAHTIKCGKCQSLIALDREVGRWTEQLLKG